MALPERPGPRIRHILFVCAGNLCRSPMAEGLFRKFLEQNGVPDVEVSSAGLIAFDGLKAASFSVLAAAERGIDIASHRSRPLTQAIMEKADLVLAMELDQVEEILSRTIGHEEKVHMVSSFSRKQLRLAEVDDPYGGPIEEYRACLDHLRELLEELFIALARGSEMGYIEVPGTTEGAR